MIKEYGTPLGWVLAWGVLVLWNLSRSGADAAANRPAVVVVATVMAAILAFWILARIVKKSRRWGAV